MQARNHRGFLDSESDIFGASLGTHDSLPWTRKCAGQVEMHRTRPPCCNAMLLSQPLETPVPWATLLKTTHRIYELDEDNALFVWKASIETDRKGGSDKQNQGTLQGPHPHPIITTNRLFLHWVNSLRNKLHFTMRSATRMSLQQNTFEYDLKHGALQMSLIICIPGS